MFIQIVGAMPHPLLVITVLWLGYQEEMGEHRVLDQKTQALAQALPFISPHSCGVLTCKIGIVIPFLRRSGIP